MCNETSEPGRGREGVYSAALEAPNPTRPPARLLLAALCLCGGLAGGRVLADEDGASGPPPPAAPAPQPLRSLGYAPLDGEVRFEAAEAAVWQGADGTEWLRLLPPPAGEVRLALGGQVARAKRALLRLGPQKKGERELMAVLEEGSVTGLADGKMPALVLSARLAAPPRLAAGKLVRGEPADERFVAAARLVLEEAEAPPVEAPPVPRRKGFAFPTVDDVAEAARRTVAGFTRSDSPPPSRLPALPSLAGMPATLPAYQYDRAKVEPDPAGKGFVAALTGRVRILWTFDDGGAEPRVVEAKADQVVLFLDGPNIQTARLRAAYLEGAVSLSDGDHTLRAPAMYYNLTTGRSLIREAVLSARMPGRDTTVYLRAREIHGEAVDAYEARDTVVSNSPFAVPLVALGARRVAVRQAALHGGGRGGASVEMERPRVEVEGVPLLAGPALKAASMDSALKSLDVGVGGSEGTRVQSGWDLLNLAGVAPPDQRDSLTGNLDWRGSHGPAAGVDWHVEHPRTAGDMRAYVVIEDNGTDRIPGRARIDRDDETRSLFSLEHRQMLGSGAQMQLTGHRASDAAFEETFFPELAYTQRPPDTGLRLLYGEDDWQVSGAVSMQLDDFTPDLAQWQALGYQTERMEAAFHRLGTEWFDGRVQWYSENRIGRVRPALRNDTPAERGMSDRQAQEDLGLPDAQTSQRDAWWAAGLPGGWISRVDTRQEVQMPLVSGPLNWVPWAMVRFTQWEDGYAASPMIDDSRRVMGGAGIRASTEWVGPARNFRSLALDLDGLRHVVRWEGDAGYLADNSDSTDLPVLDPDVESVQDGGFVRLGCVSTLQTHRGLGANRRSVDWLRLKQDIVLREETDDPARPIPRYHDWRPEYALGGSHSYTEALWQATDAWLLSGEATLPFDSGRVEQWGVASAFEHSDRLRTRVSYRETLVYDDHLLGFGLDYRLTAKYDLRLTQSFNFGDHDTGYLKLDLDRKLAGGFLRFSFGVDELDGRTNFGLTFRLEGVGGGRPVFD